MLLLTVSQIEKDNTEDESDEEADEDAEWVDAPFFPVEHILDEYRTQAKKAMKEPIIEDPTHKKISSAFLENLKLQNDAICESTF